jgi:hypothetical protein
VLSLVPLVTSCHRFGNKFLLASKILAPILACCFLIIFDDSSFDIAMLIKLEHVIKNSNMTLHQYMISSIAGYYQIFQNKVVFFTSWGSFLIKILKKVFFEKFENNQQYLFLNPSMILLLLLC